MKLSTTSLLILCFMCPGIIAQASATQDTQYWLTLGNTAPSPMLPPPPPGATLGFSSLSITCNPENKPPITITVNGDAATDESLPALSSGHLVCTVTGTPYEPSKLKPINGTVTFNKTNASIDYVSSSFPNIAACPPVVREEPNTFQCICVDILKDSAGDHLRVITEIPWLNPKDKNNCLNRS